MSPADQKAIAEAAATLARTSSPSGAWLKSRWAVFRAVERLDGELCDAQEDALEVAIRAAYAAGREDERAQAHHVRVADMLDNARHDR